MADAHAGICFYSYDHMNTTGIPNDIHAKNAWFPILNEMTDEIREKQRFPFLQ